MKAEVLILSADRSNCEAWVSELKAMHLAVTVNGQWPGAMRLINPDAAQVILYDMASCPGSPSEILSVAGIAGSPVVVLGRKWDAGQWLSLYKQGAYEVVSLPAPPGLILELTETALRRFGARIESGVSGWVKLFGLGRAKAGRV